MTFVITASSPEPVCWTSRFQPGDGMNESIEKPSGGVSSTFVVVASSFSVGTASVNTWLSAAGTIGGLTCACADAAAVTTSAADDGERERNRTFHLTSRVKGAVSTRPFARVCRNRRHVPATGTSTPTRSFPGVVELPLTCVAPRMLVQPLAPGAQTCVWK